MLIAEDLCRTDAVCVVTDGDCAGLVTYSVLILGRLSAKSWVRANQSTPLILGQNDLSALPQRVKTTHWLSFMVLRLSFSSLYRFVLCCVHIDFLVA